MAEEILVIGRKDISVEQLLSLINIIDGQVDNQKRVDKAKHDLAKALCQLNTVSELDEVVSHFICKSVPIYRNNISTLYLNRKKILEQLK